MFNIPTTICGANTIQYFRKASSLLVDFFIGYIKPVESVIKIL